MDMARTQLQAAADASALAAAANVNQTQATMVAVTQYIGSRQQVAGRMASVNSNDILYGNWDVSSCTFTQSSTPGNAVQVTVRADQNNGGQVGLFFGRLFGLTGATDSATAVATTNPRDICFVIDLSGSMNDDTQPDSTASINSSYPGSGTTMINNVYSDFGWNATYGSEPTQYIGQTLSGVTKGSSESNTLSQITSASGPLSKSTIPSQYRILSTDSSSTRTTKAYSWLMDIQIHTLMPAAKPLPSSTNSGNYAYWKTYIDNSWNSLSYQSYLEFVMYYGARDGQPGGSLYSELSHFSSDCPWHSESTAGGTFSFPPREMPTHASRRAIIAALQVVSNCNQNITDVNQRDWVSIVSFDSLSNGAVTQVALTSNYASAMQACTSLQAVADSDGNSTATEVGLIAAANILKPQSQGGTARNATNKIVVLMTDGQPNQYQSTSTTIKNYETAHPSSNFYGTSSYYSQDAALMQTSMMQGNNWYLYPVGLGASCDYDFMDRMARMGATANSSGQAPRGTGNPDNVESTLTTIFTSIITNPKLRLVK